MKTESMNTEAAKKRYNRIAPVYDFMEGLVERSRYSGWRELLWSKVEGNPDNVFVSGESAGGFNTMTLLLSPLAKNLFPKGFCR